MTSTEDPTDWGALYRQGVDALAADAGELAAAADRPVPATPAWTVRQVLAHLAGTASDALAGRMDGAPGAGWTDRHVAERDDADVPALLAELQQTAPAFAAVAGRSPAAVFNLVVHHADLLEALGAPPQPEGLWRPVVEATRPRWEPRGLRLPDDPQTGQVVTVDGYLLSRALFTRLDRAAVRALTAGALDDAAIDALGAFGPPPAG